MCLGFHIKPLNFKERNKLECATWQTTQTCSCHPYHLPLPFTPCGQTMSLHNNMQATLGSHLLPVAKCCPFTTTCKQRLACIYASAMHPSVHTSP